jgi:hypothetical protein
VAKIYFNTKTFFEFILSAERHLNPLPRLNRPKLIRHKVVKLHIRRRLERYTNNMAALALLDILRLE